MSYGQDRSDCGRSFTAAGRYCPFCGEPVGEQLAEAEISAEEILLELEER